MARPRTPTSTSREASWLLTNLKWISLMVFLVSGSLMWQQIMGIDIARQSHALLDLPQEVRDAIISNPRGLRHAKGSENTTAAVAVAVAAVPDACQEEYDRATASRTPGLTIDDLERSRALVGNRHRLANLAKTLGARDKPVTAVVCGGSITLGHGVVP